MQQHDQEHWVFAYGSNLHLADLRQWLVANRYDPEGIRSLKPALLRDYELVWDYRSPVRQGGAANVIPAAQSVVYGGLMHIDTPTLYALDHKEGHPERYNRGEALQPCELIAPSKPPSSAWVYEVQPAFKQPEFTAPRRHYRDLVVEGASILGLPLEWVEQLRSIPTLD